MVYVGLYALIYLHTILGEGIVHRDGLPRGVLPSRILKIEKYCPGFKVQFPLRGALVFLKTKVICFYNNLFCRENVFSGIRSSFF